jgi:hypothetical protein
MPNYQCRLLGLMLMPDYQRCHSIVDANAWLLARVDTFEFLNNKNNYKKH